MSKCITKYQEIPFTKTNVAIVKRQIMMSTNEDVEKLESSYVASGDVQGYIPLETVCSFLKRVNIWPNNSSLLYIPQRNENQCPHKMCTRMFMAPLFTITKK